VKKLNDNYQSPYVILLHKAFYPTKEVIKCFEFTHPVDFKDLNQFRSIQFKNDNEKDSVIHGFAGYFKTILYGDIEISILPYNHTPTLISWFPIYFPSIVKLIIKNILI
jgi:protein arginine N-methyltransferase 5